MEIKCAYDKLVPLSELKPHPKNPNRHSQDQIERLAKIIAYQGIRRPIRISTASGFITAGHGLLLALRHLGETEVPVNFQSYDSQDQEYADIVADNAIAAWADLDLSGINLEVPELGPEFDMDWLGLHNFAIDAFEKENREEDGKKSFAGSKQIILNFSDEDYGVFIELIKMAAQDFGAISPSDALMALLKKSYAN